MALTNQQVQQVFLAIAGRPAEGSAVAWGANSLSVSALANMVVDIRKGADFANSKETFVENLYEQLLGRPSDAEGKEFWLQALNDGVSYGDVLAQFINAVLAQPATADIYTLQNKLSIAEKISAQVNTLQGGAKAEAQLKDIMSNVKENTTIDNIQDDLNQFEGQFAKTTTVSVKQGAEEATEGSEENATTYNATYDVTKDGTIEINGSSSFSDTLNLKIVGDKDEVGGSTISDLSGITNVPNINITADKNVGKIELDVEKGQTLTISGKSNDVITVKGAATVKTGAGIDNINVSAAVDKTVTVDGGAGKDTVVLGAAATNDFTKLSLTSVEALSGKGTLSYATLNRSKFELANNTDLAVKAEKGIDLSKVTAADGASSVKIAIDGVKSGTIALSDANEGIDEAITVSGKIAKKATLTIENFKGDGAGTGDKLDLNTDGAAAKLGILAWNAGNIGTIADGSGAFINLDGVSVAKVKEAAFIGGINTTSKTATIFAQNDADSKIYVYNIVGGTAADKVQAELVLTLVGLTNVNASNAENDIVLA